MVRVERVQGTLQALLCHVWRCRDTGAPEVAEIFPAGFLISYKGLIEFGPLPLIPVQMGQVLRGVGAFCAENDWAPLPALVVNAERRRPGRGYYVGTDSARDALGWKLEDVRRCVEARELPRVAPVVRLRMELTRHVAEAEGHGRRRPGI